MAIHNYLRKWTNRSSTKLSNRCVCVCASLLTISPVTLAKALFVLLIRNYKKSHEVTLQNRVHKALSLKTATQKKHLTSALLWTLLLHCV